MSEVPLYRAPLGPYSRDMPRAIWWCQGGGGMFLMSEVPLYRTTRRSACPQSRVTPVLDPPN